MFRKICKRLSQPKITTRAPLDCTYYLCINIDKDPAALKTNNFYKGKWNKKFGLLLVVLVYLDYKIVNRNKNPTVAASNQR